MELDKFTIDDIWLGLRMIGHGRSYHAIETAVDNNKRLYVVQRRKKFVPVTKLKELFTEMGISTNPDSLVRACSYESIELDI